MKRNILVMDWSNMSFRSLYTSQWSSHSLSYDSDEEISNFVGKLATDICMILRTFDPDKALFAVDAQNPWRKDWLEDQEVGYKGQRERNKSMNWDNIFQAMKDLQGIMEEKGFDFLYKERAEADDMMCLSKETVFKRFPDCNIIIVSSDADIRQLADFNEETSQFCLVFNPISSGKGGHKKLYMTKPCLEWFNTQDKVDIFFSNLNEEKQYLKKCLEHDKKIEVSEIDPNDVVLGKIFCGDSGDNVPSFYEYYDKGKKKKLSETKYKHIKESLCLESVEDLDQKKDVLLKESLEASLKHKVDDIDVASRLDRQKKLVELKSENFPKGLKDYSADVEILLKKPYDGLPMSSIQMAKILDGTKFGGLAKAKRVRAADVFKDLDKYAEKMHIQKLF